MKRYRVSIICISNRNSQLIKGQLDNVLGKYIDFECLDSKVNYVSTLGSDLVLASGNRAAQSIANNIMDKTEILIMRRTLTKRNFDKLENIQEDKKILVVNDDQEMAVATVSLLYELGFKNNELVPYYPGCDYQKGLFDLAITPNEVRHVPYDVKEIINIGTRVIDPSTIFDILYRLQLLNTDTIGIVKEYSRDIELLSPSIGYLLNNLDEKYVDYEQVLNNVDTGLIIYDKYKNITFYNKHIKKLLKVYNIQSRTHTLYDINSFFNDILKYENDYLVTHKINGRLHSISNYPNYGNDTECNGGIITITDYRKIEKMLGSVNSKAYSRVYNAKHNFSDIIGSSSSITRSKALANNFAKFDLPIMIQGESGTGKELFAQSIHNASSKESGPFVAFNCGALSESLIESELFGYDIGAFTGAKKEGKVGLFELANGGTIFLDEIGDLPISLQGKLLRVLQEKELMRVGGTEIIPIDVRVISATNKDLLELVDNKKFRSDLYYRLNVLPLNIPPFRERKEDIRSLIEYFFSENDLKKDIAKPVMEIFLEYDWPGNGREIKNCVEYISTIDKIIIEPEDIPLYIYKNVSRDNTIKRVNVDENHEEWVYILKILYNASISGEKFGRRKISKELAKYSVFLTEAETRSLLESMQTKGLIIPTQGRGGTRITEKGIEVLKML